MRNVLIALLMFAATNVLAAPLTPTDLRTEYQTNPIGLDVTVPRFAWWKLVSNVRGERQTAYHVLVASSAAKLNANVGDIWDSGRVRSDESVHVTYAGKPLRSREEARWKVMVWDRDGKASEFSPAATFEMGLLNLTDWKASWIGLADVANPKEDGPVPYLAWRFPARRAIKRARLYATAKGLYKFYVNGKRISDDIFTPGWTNYKKRIQYQTYDITKLVKSGENGAGIELGDGWYCGHIAWAGRNNYGAQAMALAQIEIEYADGRRQTVTTNGHWRAATGPILASDLLMGESYDARKELPGWATAANETTAAWSPVTAEPMDSTPLVAQYSQTVKQIAALKPIRVTEAPAGHFIFDLGQNMVGWARLKVKGDAGTAVTIRYAEMLDRDGSIYTTNLRKAKATDAYTLKGGATEVWEPSFTFHGFRYVELTGYPGRPPMDAVTGIVVHSATPEVGSFACSNAMVNKLVHNILWGQRGNYLSVPTDCPQRDERLGWMGDAQVFIRTACYNMDVSRFMTKWTQDVDDAQGPAGDFADVSPRVGAMAEGSPAWGDAGVIVPWTVYLNYNDKRLLAERYPAMVKWVEFIKTANPDLLWRKHSGNNYGDWLNINADMPRDVLATGYFAHDADLIARSARVLGYHADAERYEQLFHDIRTAFDNAFVGPDGRIKGDTQTCYLMALRFNLLPEAQRAVATRYLVDNIHGRDDHLSTGFVGVGYLTPTLTQCGHTGLAYKLLENDTFPSWGYSIKHGATTIWERWDGWTEEKGFQDPGMNSFNHYSLGSVGEWLYQSVAGIDLDQAKPGYKHIVMRPHPGGGLTFVNGAYISEYGKIVSDWRDKDGKFTWTVTVPPNSYATVYVPTSHPASVTESGKPIRHLEGVMPLGTSEGAAVYEVGSGTYRFAATVPD